jgi:pyruvate dehydrogenase E2 component (dihydrolipoamide acetyltransferase)
VVGDLVPVGAPLLERIPAAGPALGGTPVRGHQPTVLAPPDRRMGGRAAPEQTGDGARPRAAPPVRKLARELGVDLAAVVALEAFPILNASLDVGRDDVVFHGAVHVGVAVASDDGLVVPVVHDAHERDVIGLGHEIVRITEAGRAGHLPPELLRGATFTVTNFGTAGGRFATPIVLPPQVAILGFGAVRVRPVVDGDAVVAAPTLPVSLSADHRVIDGHDATSFFEHVLAQLRDPTTITPH